MYEWLVHEMARINTRKFHLVEGPLADAQLDEVEEPLPPSYRAFLAQFGGARLYRSGGLYLVQVWPRWIEASAEEGALLQFGRTDLALAYFKESLLLAGRESPVFEWKHEHGLRQTFESFDEWLVECCRGARQLFGKAAWERIEAGPPPFSAREQAIVEARKDFRWRVVGVAANGDLRFEVHNGSTMSLPYLSIGIRGRKGKVDGGIWLPVTTVQPGETRVIEKDCYKDLLPAEDVEAFAKPDPEPEDRERYWEFRAD